MRGEPVDRAAISEQIAPCFVEVEGRRTDIVVLACTHYPFLADILADLAPWPVKWLDPAAAIARRLEAILAGRVPESGEGHALFTSGTPPNALARLLEAHGVPLRGGAVATPAI